MAEFILFDLDGTLTDSKEGIVNCVSYALKHFNIEHSLDELEIFVGPPLKEQFMSFAKLSEKDAEEGMFSRALECGLSAAVVDPYCEQIKQAYYDFLKQNTKNGG